MILHGDPYHWTLALRSLCCYGIPTPAIAEAKCTTPRVSSSYPATNYCMPLARHPRLRMGSRCDPLSDADASSLDRILWNCRTRISQCCLRGFRFWRCARRSDDVGRPSRFECINCICFPKRLLVDQRGWTNSPLNDLEMLRECFRPIIKFNQS